VHIFLIYCIPLKLINKFRQNGHEGHTVQEKELKNSLAMEDSNVFLLEDFALATPKLLKVHVNHITVIVFCQIKEPYI
jgi:hypothetical protein